MAFPGDWTFVKRPPATARFEKLPMPSGKACGLPAKKPPLVFLYLLSRLNLDGNQTETE
jgi:hypothetical protein